MKVKGQNQVCSFWPELKKLGSLSLVTSPFFQAKKSLIQSIRQQIHPREKLVVCDFRELPTVDLTSIYKLILRNLAGQSTANDPITLSSQIKRRLRSQPQTKFFLFLHTHILAPVYESFFASLESIFEEQEKLFFLFHFAHNIETERISKQLANRYLPYQKIIYLKNEPKKIAAQKIFSNLNEIQQIILRQIFAGRFQLRPEIASDVCYLEKTGLVTKNKNNYQIAYQAINRFLYQQNSRGQVGNFEVMGQNIFYEGENLTRFMSTKQRKLLSLLINKKNQLITKEMMAQTLWPTSWEAKTNWAIDKTIARLRHRLRMICACDPIEIKRGRGLIFSADNDRLLNQINTKTKRKKVKFVPLQNNHQTQAFYFQAFNAADRRYLFATSPRTKFDIRIWLDNLLKDESYSYESIYYQAKLVGHVGLKHINHRLKISSFGTLVYPHKLWPKIGRKIFERLIEKAKETNLDAISYHPNQNNFQERQLAGKFGFRSLPGNESKLRLELSSAIS